MGWKPKPSLLHTTLTCLERSTARSACLAWPRCPWFGQSTVDLPVPFSRLCLHLTPLLSVWGRAARAAPWRTSPGRDRACGLGDRTGFIHRDSLRPTLRHTSCSLRILSPPSSFITPRIGFREATDFLTHCGQRKTELSRANDRPQSLQNPTQ